MAAVVAALGCQPPGSHPVEEMGDDGKRLRMKDGVEGSEERGGTA